MIDVAGSLPKHALELFECPSIGGKPRLTRTSCGQRHKAARRTAKPTRGPLVTPWLATCAGCEIGAAHARGERPDVTTAQLVRSREVVEMPSAKGQTYAHEGKTLTLEGWAREPGVTLSAQAIRSRIEHGWLFADALTTPKGAPRPSTSGAARRAAPKRARKASPEQVAAAVERVERRAVPTLVEEVRATVASVHVAELLTRLGRLRRRGRGARSCRPAPARAGCCVSAHVMTPDEERFVEALGALVNIARHMGVSAGSLSGALLAQAGNVAGAHLGFDEDASARLAAAALEGMCEAARSEVSS